MDDIFSDPYYIRFSQCLHKVLEEYRPNVHPLGKTSSRAVCGGERLRERALSALWKPLERETYSSLNLLCGCDDDDDDGNDDLEKRTC